MAVTGTKTVRDVVTTALRKARIIGAGEDADADDAETALDELNLMLKEWQNEGHNVWTLTSGSLTLTTAASYTLSPVRPLSIHNARLKRSGIEIPMIEMTREEYDSLPQKSSTGIPTQFYYDRQREDAKLYIWPVLATASGETIEYTYQREIEDHTSLNDTLDVPGEMWTAVVYSLAARMVETYGLENPTVMARAEHLLRKALAFDQQGSVYFCGEGSCP